MSKTINLLPDPVIETQKEVSTVYQGTLVSIIGLIVFLLINLIFLFFHVRATNMYGGIQAEAALVQEEISAFSSLTSDLRLLQARVQRFVRQELNNVNGHAVLTSVLQSDVEGITVANIEIVNKDLELTVHASTLEQAVEFLRAIKRQEQFPSFNINDLGYDGIDEVVSFRVTVTIDTQK